MVHDDKLTLAWFYSDRRELLFGIERVRGESGCSYILQHLPLTAFTFCFLTDQMKGFVSIFQLLGRYVRRISVVLLLQSCKVSECKLVTINVLQHCHLLLLTAFISCFQPIRD